MYLIDILIQYKEEFISIGETQKQKSYLSECFIKWYINADKIGVEKLFPARNILTMENYDDLIFANKNKYTKFNILELIKLTNDVYDKYYDLCKDILDLQDVDVKPILNMISNHDELDNEWVYVGAVVNKCQYNRLKMLYFSMQSSKQNKYTDEFDGSKLLDVGYKTRKKYIEKFNNFKKDYKKLLKLYEFIEIDNTTHLSIPPIYKGIELFGSCVNTHNDEFCSLFELEKKFASLGSFWDYKFHKNSIYLCNPPFNIPLIKKMALKLIDDLCSTEFDVVLIQVLPIWDSVSQKKIGAKDFKMGFEGYDILINNRFLKEKIILEKDEYKYWNYSTKKHVSSSHTHLIVLSNMENMSYKRVFNIEAFTKQWKEFSSSPQRDICLD